MRPGDLHPAFQDAEVLLFGAALARERLFFASRLTVTEEILASAVLFLDEPREKD
jgi:hypothetical protein